MIRSLVDGDASRRWIARFVTASLVWALLVLGLAAADADPSPVPLAAVILAATVAVSLVLDLGDEPTASLWPTSPLAEGPRGDDPRVRRLQQVIESAASSDGHSGPVRRILHAVVDERVAAGHGVTNGEDPLRYAEIVGADLIEWLTADAPESVAPPITRRELLGILHRIEAL